MLIIAARALRIGSIAGLIVFFSHAAGSAHAVDLWPSTDYTIAVRRSAAERGLLLTEALGGAVEFGMEYAPLHLALDASYFDDEYSGRYGYDVSCEGVKAGLLFGIGLTGARFRFDDSAFLKHRTETYVLVGSDPDRAGLFRWECMLMYSLDKSEALYSSFALSSTRRISDRVDLDLRGLTGIGDDGFASRQLKGYSFDSDEDLSWQHSLVEVSVPVMFDTFDLLPSVTYVTVMDDSSRNTLKKAGVETSSWLFGLAVRFYGN